MSAEPFLAALLTTLLPGNAGWPAADTTESPARFAARLAVNAALAAATEAQRRALPADFAARSLAERTQLLTAREGADRGAFALVLSEAYMAYYSDPRVLQAIERRTGFPAAPPQPGGRHLDAFDWSFLDSRKGPVKPV